MIDPDLQDMLDEHQRVLANWATAEAKLAQITLLVQRLHLEAAGLKGSVTGGVTGEIAERFDAILKQQ